MVRFQGLEREKKRGRIEFGIGKKYESQIVERFVLKIKYVSKNIGNQKMMIYLGSISRLKRNEVNISSVVIVDLVIKFYRFEV